VSEFDGTILFKEWLPDQPDLNNPGLTEALNVLALDAKYACSPTFNTAGSTATCPSSVTGAFIANASGSGVLYAGLGSGGVRANSIYTTTASSFFSVNGSTTIGAIQKFVQYNNLVLGVGTGSQSIQITAGSAAYTALATSGTAPSNAQAIGVIGQFVFIATGNLVQWSGIDAPTSWPTPNSDTAIAQQSGSQTLDISGGSVFDIFGSDQFGVILQVNRVTRVTYAGPPVVFQFDAIDTTEGSVFQKGAVQVGKLIYYISRTGFRRTDGVNVERIGEGKVDRYFWDNLDLSGGIAPSRITAGYDPLRNLVYWAWPRGVGVTQNNDVLIFNPSNNRWTHSDMPLWLIVQNVLGTQPQVINGHQGRVLGAFDQSFRFSLLDGAPGTGTLTSSEAELNAGGRALVQGVKPLIDATANAITVALGTRNDRTSSVNYTSEVTANSRSGFCNFRSDARYHRARLTVAGTFNAAQGLEYEAVPSGYI